LCSACKTSSQPNTFTGSWIIKEVKTKYIGGELSENEVEELVGDTLVIKNNSASILGESCKEVNQTIKQVDIKKYLYVRYRSNISASDLDITENKIEVLKLSCKEKDPSSNYFDFAFLVLNKNKLILEWKEFLVLERSKNQP